MPQCTNMTHREKMLISLALVSIKGVGNPGQARGLANT